jgi:hypothetical protein
MKGTSANLKRTNAPRPGREQLPRIAIEDDRDQLPLFPAPLATAGRTWSLQMTVEFPGGADPELVKRLDNAARRLRRGAVAGTWKLKKLATALEGVAGLFDGVK